MLSIHVEHTEKLSLDYALTAKEEYVAHRKISVLLFSKMFGAGYQ